MFHSSLSLKFGFVPSVSAAWSQSTQLRPSALLHAGIIIGEATSVPSSPVTLNKYLGIPFAVPPQRFAPPVPPKQWKKPLEATTNGSACIQQFDDSKVENEFLTALFDTPPPSSGESEDCLYVNVYAPASPAPNGGRTVMFWIYGGAP